MDKKDVLRLLDLLNTGCASSPSAKRADPNDEKTVLAWSLLLEPYTYEQAREGALIQMRKSRFFPAPAEIVENIPRETPKQEDDKSRLTVTPEMMVALEKAKAQVAQYDARLHANGLPTFLEAKARGMTFREWSAMCKKKEKLC